MQFHIYQCKMDRDYFIVTDAAHCQTVESGKVCPSPGDGVEKVGVFDEMGKKRVAFDEGLAKRSIESQGFFRFEAKSFDPVAERPISMP